MTFPLSHRQADLVEQMDKADCDPQKLIATYRQFHLINRLLSQWRRVYVNRVRPLMTDPGTSYSLLDIGFGGGDIPLSFAKWASEDGFNLQITAIETDQRALDYVESLDYPKSIHFQSKHSSELVKEKAQFDFVISNHVLHHLDEKELKKVLGDAEQLARHLVIFNDIERHPVGYLLFNLFSRILFRNSFITEDGLISIRKSYTYNELRSQQLDGWEVRRLFPFRLLLIKESHG